MEKDINKELKSLADELEEIASKICDHYCKYPNEPGHEDDPDWLFSEGGPCNDCPLNRLF